MYLLNVRDYGAYGDKLKDDTQAFQSVFDAVMQKGFGTVYIPAGTYIITSSIKIKGSNVTITGDGKKTHLIYTYEQEKGDDFDTASLLSFAEGVSDITVKNLKLEYKGFFFPEFGQSYDGRVSGILFRMCRNVLIENVEIYKFNASGIQISTGDSGKYARKFKVNKCYLHHNRVAGVLYGYVDGISITNCDLEYHGSIYDGGTGYGCAGSSSELPKNIQISGNRAFYNYRKGIDLHAGIGVVIEGNICHENRLYGIYTKGKKTGNVIIRGNIVSGMKKKASELSRYPLIAGIDFGPYAEDLVTEDYHNYLVEGNQILNFGLDEGHAWPIRCYYNFKTGMIQIKNNMVKASRVDYLIGFENASKKSGRNVKVDISGNQAFIEKVSKYPFILQDIKELNIHGNQISIGNTEKSDGLIDFSGYTPKTFTLTNNHIESENVRSIVKKVDFEPAAKKMFFAGNFLNGLPDKK